MNSSAASGVHNGIRTCGLSCRRRPLCPLSYVDCFFTMAGTERFELPNDRVRAGCLTAWLYPNMVHLEGFEPSRLSQTLVPETSASTVPPRMQLW